MEDMMLSTAEPILLISLFIMGYLLLYVGEWRRHRINSRFLAFAGATVISPGLMRTYYLIILCFLPFALVESLARPVWTVEAVQIIGLFMLLAGLILRAWALTTLGPAWTMSCLYWPQMPRIRRGPFRYLRHPEYLSRLLDCTGLCLALGALWTAGFVFVVVTLLSWFIIKIENLYLVAMREEENDAEPLPDEGFVS